MMAVNNIAVGRKSMACYTTNIFSNRIDTEFLVIRHNHNTSVNKSAVPGKSFYFLKVSPTMGA